MFSDELITQIKRVNRIEDVVREFGVELKRNKALCPFHQEKDPSFSVDPKKQIARCFSCMDRAVDVIGFVVKVNGFSFVEAVEFLAQRAGIELEPLTPEQKRAIQKSIRRKEILDITVQFYHKRLIENKYQDPLGYIKERGFTKEILDSFKIGLAEKEGLRCAFVEIRFPGEGHSIIAFETIDEGFVYLDAITDDRVRPIIGKRYYQCIEPKPGYYYTKPPYDDTIKDILIIW